MASASRATELRRRVENRRQAALTEAKCVEDEAEEHVEATDAMESPSTKSEASYTSSVRRTRLPAAMLPSLLSAKKDLYGIQMEVFESDARQLASIRCADQQFTVDKNVRRLKSDLHATQMSVRQKVDRLDDLQSRVLRLSRLLTDTRDESTFVRTKIGVDEDIRKEQVQPQLSTMNYNIQCVSPAANMLSPVAPNQFRLTHLTANQEYGKISIAAITKNGKSAPSNVVETVKLAPAVAPTEPLFVSVGTVTAKTITLSWIEPTDDGGVPIVDYEISFVEAIMEETITHDKNFLDVSEIVYKSRLVRTYSASTTFTVPDLLSGKEHKKFEIRAVNSAGIPGKFSTVIESIFTIAPGSEFKLLDELQAAVNARTRIVDSQFLSGFMQRYERHHYIDLVSRFILSIHPELESKVHTILHGNDPLADEEVESTAASSVFRRRWEDLSDEEINAERRRQFHFRIAELGRELARVDYNIQWCKDQRIHLVSLIRAAETRILEKQAELERARMFRGPQMDSDVLENGLQRFHTKELILALEDEIEIEQLYIVDAKSEIVKVENYFRADEKHRTTVLKRIKDRQSALASFELNPRAALNNSDTKKSTLVRLRDGLLYRTFAALVENRDACRDMRRKMRAAINRMIMCKTRHALLHWRANMKALAREQAMGDPNCAGVGTIGLVNAAIGRYELVSDTRSLLDQIRRTDSKLQQLAWTSEQVANMKAESASADTSHEEHHKFYPFWLEVEAKMDVADWEGGLRVLEFIQSNSGWVEGMSAQRVFDLQLKIGQAHFQMKKYDHALIAYNRASILASRCQNQLNEGTAMLHLGATHFAVGSLQQSIKHYEQALLSFEAANDARGEVACYRGLERVFTKLDDREMMTTNKKLAEEIEFALQNKLAGAGDQLQRLQQRLVGIGAESSKEIELERVGAIVTRLRRDRIKSKYRIREEHKRIASLEKLLREKKELLVQGEIDLKRALASDSTQVESNVINGSFARYEIEDFKHKLAKLMGGVKAGEEHIAKEIMNAKIRISNGEDEIKELESELVVETGALMRRMQSKERIRCFRFNATNEALKNVIGTASHGYTTCVASAGHNGLLFDLLSGACLSQALGDPHKEHLGDPTGHQAQIVSLFYFGHRIYTGSVDASLGVWSVKDEDIGGFSCVLQKLVTDFDSTVVSVTSDNEWVMCGSSDCDVFLFDAMKLTLIARIITAHSRSATALVVRSSKLSLTTGGADNRIKVWEVGPPSNSTTRRNVKLVHTLEAERKGDEYFNGHLHPITCMQQIASEIVSADSNGRIVIWNLEADTKLLRICNIHKVAVACLQFDAMKIVSGGADGSICVTDFATGHLLQTLVGHRDSILDLQFDRSRLISMSADGKVRLWYWQTRIGVGADRKKYHILGPGETLKSLSLRYRSSIEKLLKWNNIPDSSKLYLGQKLVVDIDTNGVASDELKTLDMAVSTQFGKLSYENLDFMAANKVQSTDVESQWAAQRLALLAKEYFPPLDDDNENESKKDEGESEEEDDSDEDSLMAVDTNEEPGENEGSESEETKNGK
ncbi:hypothetical protein Poli38472_008519 [Pythium oligandrum]|uniref:Uncharacterized protein n=1 Tax=Pythium oligandrum TaxID=41045 RepID=A0A8K1C3P5_PYTOL|nr:hypothetical protein Poli38472_008519 [Pythium oligandrum]|eukprot:TMW55871.1 hypothetical protein Poli38472_008519 [Pythium oligandrum]